MHIAVFLFSLDIHIEFDRCLNEICEKSFQDVACVFPDPGRAKQIAGVQIVDDPDLCLAVIIEKIAFKIEKLKFSITKICQRGEIDEAFSEKRVDPG